ncbi:hypothetical protein F6Q10_01330 [Streptomyces vinaceus]|nr:hypothetical protein [Streptomyces vinaceus]
MARVTAPETAPGPPRAAAFAAMRSSTACGWVPVSHGRIDCEGTRVGKSALLAEVDDEDVVGGSTQLLDGLDRRAGGAGPLARLGVVLVE